MSLMCSCGINAHQEHNISRINNYNLDYIFEHEPKEDILPNEVKNKEVHTPAKVSPGEGRPISDPDNLDSALSRHTLSALDSIDDTGEETQDTTPDQVRTVIEGSLEVQTPATQQERPPRKCKASNHTPPIHAVDGNQGERGAYSRTTVGALFPPSHSPKCEEKRAEDPFHHNDVWPYVDCDGCWCHT